MLNCKNLEARNILSHKLSQQPQQQKRNNIDNSTNKNNNDKNNDTTAIPIVNCVTHITIAAMIYM